MRATTAVKIRIGVTVTLVFVILFVSYSWLTKNRISKEKHYYHIKFSELGWVNKGDPVLVKGVTKGFIKDIKFYPDSVIVDIVLEDIQLRQGATAKLVSSGIVGQMRVNVSMGHGKPLPDWSTLEGKKERSLGEIIADLGRVMDTLQEVIHETHILVETSTSSIDTLTKSLNTTLDTVRLLLAREKENVDSTQRAIIASLERIQELTDSLLHGSGTVGQLVASDSLYRRADSSLVELIKLINDIKEHPERYVNLHVKLF